jgi:DNA processing protein
LGPRNLGKIQASGEVPKLIAGKQRMVSDSQKLAQAVELTLVPGVGSRTQLRLWRSFSDTEGVFNRTARSLEAAGVTPDARDAIAARRYRGMAEEIVSWAQHEGCRILLAGTAGYPELLSEIADPPLILYTRGRAEALEGPAVAVVGTRRPTCYGLQMAEGIASDLAARGISVVSGLARGIDASAHRGSLASHGLTVAVLGCGIDVIYPREHRRLTAQVLEHGLLVTEFPPGTSPAPQNFPVRNRIISGIALGTVIVEASEYSGSLITARLAMEQNREVFALPGNITSPQSFGPNFLIKQGAKLVQSWRDIVEELPPELRVRILAADEVVENPPESLDLLGEDEIRVLELLAPDRATEFDKLFRASGVSIPQLSDLLLHLEMQGRIRQMPGNLYLKVARPLR